MTKPSIIHGPDGVFIILYKLIGTCILKSSFSKRDRRQSKNPVCNARAKFGDHVFLNMHIYTHVYIYENLFFKNTIYELGISITSSFGEGMALITI